MSKKLFALMSVLVIGSMLLAACGTAPTPTAPAPTRTALPNTYLSTDDAAGGGFEWSAQNALDFGDNDDYVVFHYEGGRKVYISTSLPGTTVEKAGDKLGFNFFIEEVDGHGLHIGPNQGSGCESNLGSAVSMTALNTVTVNEQVNYQITCTLSTGEQIIGEVDLGIRSYFESTLAATTQTAAITTRTPAVTRTQIKTATPVTATGTPTAIKTATPQTPVATPEPVSCYGNHQGANYTVNFNDVEATCKPGLVDTQDQVKTFSFIMDGQDYNLTVIREYTTATYNLSGEGIDENAYCTLTGVSTEDNTNVSLTGDNHTGRLTGVQQSSVVRFICSIHDGAITITGTSWFK